MSLLCPDNSTECLLRAILNAQPSPGFDWNPLNFAFTAAIGVLALAVAITTVFQGFLSAGLERSRLLRPPSAHGRIGLALDLTGKSSDFGLLLSSLS
jgi:hypothetical protein